MPIISERGERDDGLIVHAELAAHERAPQATLDLQPAHSPRPHRVVEQLDPAAAELLRGEHRDIGVAQQAGRRVVRPLGHDDPHARVEEDLVRAERERLVEHPAQPVRERHHVVDAGNVVADDGELVAAEARQTISGAQHAAEPAGRGGEQFVARFVAQAVVHDLEVVDVEHHQADRRVGRARTQRVLQPLDEHHAVRQLGQRIVACAVRELGFDAAVLADVVRGADELDALALGVQDWRHVDGDAPGRHARAPLGFERHLAAFARGAGEGAHVRDECVGRHHTTQVAGGRVVTEQAPVGVVRVDEPEDVVTVDRDGERRVRKQVEQRRVRHRLAAGVRTRARVARHRRERRGAPHLVALGTVRLPTLHRMLSPSSQLSAPWQST